MGDIYAIIIDWIKVYQKHALINIMVGSSKYGNLSYPSFRINSLGVHSVIRITLFQEQELSL